MRSQRALAEATELDVKTIGKIERGEKVGDTSLMAVDIALGWLPGQGVLALIEGRKPVENQDAPPPSNPEPEPADYPDELEYMNAVYWYLRRRGMSHDAVMRGFNMAAAIHERRIAERNSPVAGGENHAPNG